MTAPSTPTTPNAPTLIVFGVGDLDAAKTLYSAVLGTQPYVDSPYYVGYRAGDVEVGLDPNAARQGTTAPITSSPSTNWLQAPASGPGSS